MTLKEKIRGALFGSALGDALGLGTELMTKSEVMTYYPDGLRHFDQIICDAHRSQWNRAQWTNDTDLLLLLIDSVMECNGIDHLDYTRRLKKWFDNDPTDVVSIYRWVITADGWDADPIGSASETWRRRGLRDASNEAIYRALITGLVSGKNLLRDTTNIIGITHDDPRCISSAMLVARMAESLFKEGKEAEYSELESISNSIDDRTTPYLHKALHAGIEDMSLDDMETYWYTRKAMCVSLWALWHCDSAEEILYKVIDAGGDADTNASIAMFLAGLKYGYDALPDEVEKLIDYNRLEEYVDKFSAFLESKEKKNSTTFE